MASPSICARRVEVVAHPFQLIVGRFQSVLITFDFQGVSFCALDDGGLVRIVVELSQLLRCDPHTIV